MVVPPFPITIAPFWVAVAIVWICMFLSVMHGPNGGFAALRCILVLVLGVAMLTVLTLLARLSLAATWVSVLVMPVLGLVLYLIGFTWCRGQQQLLYEKLDAWLEPILGPKLAARARDTIAGWLGLKSASR